MSTTSPEDAPSEPSAAAAAAAASAAHEPLACVNCRSRKLKCDRQKPVCARCVRAGGECIYPESRRKPAFKRKNVRELEERLAQVEGLLRTVGKQRATRPARSDGAGTEGSSPVTLGRDTARSERFQSSPLEGAMPWIPHSPVESPSSGDNAQSGELLGLGRFESLPPIDMIEDLHTVYFATQQDFLPIIHPGNYMRSFHSPPHMRPPMCLQYAIWTAASNGHPKYGCYHDALYRRARQYLEADELKGHGEHFITIGHAQAWALVATDEARAMLFTRASMSSARSVRLAGMMGLQRLDSTLTDDEVPMAPMIIPHRTWAELEERRRLFWGGFCIDTYASISTGWPTLIDMDQITTHLPVSEDAFNSSTEEKTSTLQDALKGANYSTFAGNVIICHIFTRLMKHAQRPMPGDRPEDPDFGPFWTRHRELDNVLSSAFMFLPERFRLSSNLGDPIAMQANLNLHGAVICLHAAAREKADRFKLAGIRQASRTRASTAAQEIIDIMKAPSHMRAVYKSPLMSLSLYLAASVYIGQAKDDPAEFDQVNLELIVDFMSSIGREHVITHAYLNQLLRDVKRAGISLSHDRIPNFVVPSKYCNYSIPIVARGSTSRHSKIQPPLPGRLPLGAPLGIAPSSGGPIPFVPCASFIGPYPSAEDTHGSDGPASKRVRTSAMPSSGARVNIPDYSSWIPGGGAQTYVDPAPDLFEYTGGGWSYTTKYTTNPITTLPHRTGSPAVNSRAMPMPMPPAAAVPDFTGFSMPGSTNPFSHMPSTVPSTGRGFGLDTNIPFNAATTSLNSASTTTTSDNNPNPNFNLGQDQDQNLNPADLPDLTLFDNFREWDLADPQSLFGMLLSMSTSAGGGDGGGGGGGAGEADDGFGATSQDSMDTWTQPEQRR